MFVGAVGCGVVSSVVSWSRNWPCMNVVPLSGWSVAAVPLSSMTWANPASS